jgi:hypothetical protein
VLRVVSPPNLLSTICLLTRIYRQHAPILRGLPYVRSNSLLHLPDARIPRRHVPVPTPHGFYREPQFFHEFQAYVRPHVALCRNPNAATTLAHFRPHSPQFPPVSRLTLCLGYMLLTL